MDKIQWIKPQKNRSEMSVNISKYVISFNVSCYAFISQFGNKIMFGKADEGFVFQIGQTGLELSTTQHKGALNNSKYIGNLRESGLTYGKYGIERLDDNGLFKLVPLEIKKREVSF